MRRSIAAIFALLLLSAFALAACGGDDGSSDVSGSDSGSDTSSDGSTAVDVSGDGDAVDLEMELADFSFSPNAITAAPGQELTIALTNSGQTNHTFTGEGVDEELAAGDSATVTVTVPDGTFAFFCSFHQNQGMEGEISTTAAGSGGGTTPTTSASTSGGAPGY